MPHAGTSKSETFDEFMIRRKEASDRFVNGDPRSLDDIATQVSPASLFGPAGDHVEGADQVNAVNEKGAKSFDAGGTNRFDILQSDANDDMGFWAGIQRSTLRMKGKDEPVTMSLRVTEVFVRQGGAWKLVHRHADPLKSEAEQHKK